MFDFFRDLAMESRGIDSETVHKIQEEKKRQKKQDKVFLPKPFKRAVCLFGILYLAGGLINIISLRMISASPASVIIYFILNALVVAIILAMVIGTKKSEVTGLILIGIFLPVMYLSILLK